MVSAPSDSQPKCSSKMNLSRNRVLFRKLANITAIVCVALSLAACEKLPTILKEDLVEFVCSIPLLCGNKNRVALDVDEFNYTDYEVGGVAVQAPNKNDTKSASSGMVVWKKSQKPPVSIKVWWEVVYDKQLWNHGAGYDSFKDKKAAPGTVWCEAIVKLKEPFPDNPQQLAVHFFPDGHVAAAVVHNPAPIVSDAQKSKLPRLPAGKYCEKTIDNPWYGVDTSNPGA